MARYFFDFKTDDAFANDEDGVELPNVEAAHNEAVDSLGEMFVVKEGATDQHFIINVRDELGPVLQITAVIGSTIFRKQ
jgi:hypothetical protein